MTNRAIPQGRNVLGPVEVSEELLDLIPELMRRLLSGGSAAAATLREQYARASITEIYFSGVGFFAQFSVPDDVHRLEQRRLAGGDVRMNLDDSELGGGCVLFVVEGVISCLEGYVFTGEWPDRPKVLSLGDVVPLVP